MNFFLNKMGMFLLLLTVMNVAKSEVQSAYVTNDSTFKKSTAQSSSLPAGDKCSVLKNQVYEISGDVELLGNHYKVTLARAIDGCSFTSGYFFKEHLAAGSTVITIHTPTIFKKSTASSSQLPPSQKCTMNPGVFRLSSVPTEASAHYQVNFATVPAGCNFSSGYLYNGHSMPQVMAMTLTGSNFFKKSTANSSTLPASDKCLLEQGNYILKAPADAADSDHYKVTLAEPVAGCGFTSGYVFYYFTTFVQPTASPSLAWDFPLLDGGLGSNWCVCRNVGTSPHIGQDFVKFGAKQAIAVNDGKVTDIRFSSTCGYIASLEDDFGGIWRYVHLNNPNISEGQRVSRGQLLANISAYPRSGCGTGPHLHMERRSSGAFGDSSLGKSCQSGFRTCYYDPIKPWRQTTNSAMSSSTEIASGGINIETNDQSSINRVCKINPNNYPIMALGKFKKYERKSLDNLTVTLQATQLKNSVIDSAKVISGRVFLEGNEANKCSYKENNNCITSWGLAVETTSGNYKRMFFDTAVRNSTAVRLEQEAFCLPTNATGNYKLFGTDSSGDKFIKSGRF